MKQYINTNHSYIYSLLLIDIKSRDKNYHLYVNDGQTIEQIFINI